MGQLDNKVALVIGATSGIGRATAARFIAEGAHVFATGRRQAELDDLAGEYGSAVTAVRNDLSEVASLDDLYRVIAAHGGGLDILVANAGGGSLATLEEMTPASFEETFIGYVRGIVVAVQKALPLLNAGASLVVTGSTATTRATKAFGAYSAAKAALRQFVRVWAVELADRGVRVNTVNPGPIQTAALKKQASDPADTRARRRDSPCATAPARPTSRGSRSDPVPRLGPRELRHRRRIVRRRRPRAGLNTSGRRPLPSNPDRAGLPTATRHHVD